MALQVIQRLKRLEGLTEAQRERLAAAFSTRLVLPGGAELRRDEQYVDSTTLLLRGCACGYRIFRDGRRKIVGLFFPGNFCDLPAVLFREPGYGVRALGPCTAARAPRAEIHRLASSDPAIAMALWRESLIEVAIAREWMAGARRSAQRQVAHLLCEVLFRTQGAGLGNGTSCPLTLTQVEMADALGLSFVIVNRVLQDLRARKLISLRNGVLVVHDLGGLCEIGDFTPDYCQPPAYFPPDGTAQAFPGLAAAPQDHRRLCQKNASD